MNLTLHTSSGPDPALLALWVALPVDPDDWPQVEGTVTVPAWAVRDLVNRHRRVDEYTDRELIWLHACHVADWLGEQDNPSPDWLYGHKAIWLPVHGEDIAQMLRARGIEP